MEGDKVVERKGMGMEAKVKVKVVQLRAGNAVCLVNSEMQLATVQFYILIPNKYRYSQWYGPDAAAAQPMAWNALAAASSFAFCLLFPVPSPFITPLTRQCTTQIRAWPGPD